MKNEFRLPVDFLSEAGVQNSKPSPMPVTTRWFSKIKTVFHYKEYFDHYPTMMKTIQNDYGDADGVGQLLQLFINVEKYKPMK